MGLKETAKEDVNWIWYYVLG